MARVTRRPFKKRPINVGYAGYRARVGLSELSGQYSGRNSAVFSSSVPRDSTTFACTIVRLDTPASSAISAAETVNRAPGAQLGFPTDFHSCSATMYQSSMACLLLPVLRQGQSQPYGMENVRGLKLEARQHHETALRGALGVILRFSNPQPLP